MSAAAVHDAHLAFTGFAGRRLHLGVCGSIAAYRAPDLLRMWMQAGVPAGVTLTGSAQRFISALTFSALGASPVLTGMFADNCSAQDSQEVFGHLLPGQSAAALIVAPATAASLARFAHGLADDLLTCQVLAFSGPRVAAPAMNPRMWANPATQENVEILRRRGWQVVTPDYGTTACLEEGQGRLADIRHIYLHGLKAVTEQRLAGAHALLTLGPTVESWDAVRIWTNRSSGIMGASLAVALWLRGARVTAVCGPGAPWLPPEIEIVPVGTAQEMFEAASAVFPQANIAAFTAAVADFKPTRPSGGKFKKSASPQGFSVEFTPNPDIFATLGAQKRPGQRLIGFAAETEGLLEQMHAKLAVKRADLMVGNLIGGPDTAFASPANRVTILDAAGRHEDWPLLPKPEVAWRITEWLLRL